MMTGCGLGRWAAAPGDVATWTRSWQGAVGGGFGCLGVHSRWILGGFGGQSTKAEIQVGSDNDGAQERLDLPEGVVAASSSLPP